MISKIYKSNFAKNILILTTGSFGAQAINLFFSPLLTRLYGPEVFGILGVFVGVLSILTPVAALTYPGAIVLPKNDSHAFSIVQLSLYLSLMVSFIVALIFFIGGSGLLVFIGSATIAPYIYLIPLALILVAWLQASQQWLTRKKEYKLTAKVSILQSIISNSFKALFGLIHPSAGALIIITILGNMLYVMLSVLGINKFKVSKLGGLFSIGNEDVRACLQVARQYRDFPTYRAPQALINTVALSLPLLLLSKFSGTASAGLYSICSMALILPTMVLGNAVADVFYRRLSEAAHRNENISGLIMKATAGVAILGFLPFLSVVLLGPDLFQFAFGSEWVKAGEYGRWIAIMSYFSFVGRVSAASIPVLNMQSWLLKFELLSTALKIGGLFLGFFVFKSDIAAIASFSILAALTNFILIVLVMLVSVKIKTVRSV